MTDLERVKKVINWYIYQGIGQNNTEIATKLGYTKSSFSQILGGKVPLSDKFLEKLSVLDKNINFVWLKSGEGTMLSEEYAPKKAIKVQNSESKSGIPLIPSSAVAGMFQGETIVLEYECDRYIVPAFKDAEFLISVKGSSMIPKYNSGDIVACKRLPLDTFFQWNKVYVIDTEQGPLIKRVKKGSGDETLTICSDNPSYEPFELHRSKIYHIALVVGVIRLE